MTCTSFEGTKKIATGDLLTVALQTKAVLDRGEQAPVFIFDHETSRLVEVDFRGTPDEVRSRLAPGPVPQAAPRGPGRPKLGVVAREVTLLPRHWEWLNAQPGGASVALRKLVEDARRNNADKDRVRQAQDAAFRFLTAMAGNEPGFEESLRALFAGNRERFYECSDLWPSDVRDHARYLADPAFADVGSLQPVVAQ